MSHIRGRFKKAAAESVAKYTASVHFDWHLYRYDIAGSIAHARMLARQGIISDQDASTITAALEEISKEIEERKLKFNPEMEDIHMTIEARLLEKVGEAGGKLHTARSRNDQVALDLRLFAKDAITETQARIRALQKAIIDLAEANKEVIMAGYTHMQPAQPVLLAHHLLAYFEMLQRDYGRFADCLARVDTMPLGSGALAGVPYNIDRESVAKELGFSRISRNSLDAVSDRDYVVEYEAAASLCLAHLSRLAEELVMWSSAEFGFIELDEAYTTGSSIMPQKKNPDVAELARGRTGRVYGHLVAMLTVLKGLPLSYNRDLQEDKEGFFDTVETLLSTLEVMAGMLGTLQVRPENMGRAARQGYILATDIADYLVGKGLPFRTAHEAVGKLVSYAVEKGKGLSELKLADYRKFSKLFARDVFSITAETSVAARDVPGGTAPDRVREAIAEARKLLAVRGG